MAKILTEVQLEYNWLSGIPVPVRGQREVVKENQLVVCFPYSGLLSFSLTIFIGGGVQGQQNSSHIKQDKSDSRGGSGGGNHREGDWNCAGNYF